MIVLDQLPKLFGIHITKAGFFRDILSVAHHLPETSLRRSWWPGRRSPCSSPWSACGRTRRRRSSPWEGGSPRCGSRFAVVGVSTRRPDSARAPDHAAGSRACRAALPGALGIALMSFTETIAAGAPSPSRATRPSTRTGSSSPRVANLGGALLGAMPAGGGTSQTAVVRPPAGGRRRRPSSPRASRRRRCCCWRRCWACCQCHARGHRDRLLGRTHPARGVPGHPPGAHHGVPLGGHRRGRRAVSARSRASSSPSCCRCSGSRARRPTRGCRSSAASAARTCSVRSRPTTRRRDVRGCSSCGRRGVRTS